MSCYLFGPRLCAHQRAPAVSLTRVLVLHSPGTQHVVSDLILTQGSLTPGHRDHGHLMMNQSDHSMQSIDQSGLTLTSCSISARKEEPSLVTPQPATVIGLFSLIPEKMEDQGNEEIANIFIIIITWRWQTDCPEVMKVCRVLQSPERDVIVVGDLVVARMSHHVGHLMNPHHSVTDLTNQITP